MSHLYLSVEASERGDDFIKYNHHTRQTQTYIKATIKFEGTCSNKSIIHNANDDEVHPSFEAAKVQGFSTLRMPVGTISYLKAGDSEVSNPKPFTSPKPHQEDAVAYDPFLRFSSDKRRHRLQHNTVIFSAFQMQVFMSAGSNTSWEGSYH